ncbi:MAG: alpha-amylase, partial [Actinobacteria bacterium]|nr:alpha-amylase [Actinomycetota bacterium]
ALARCQREEEPPPLDGAHLVDLADLDAPDIVHELVGPSLDMARLLGQRTAELHVELASGIDDPLFKPEPLTPFAQKALYQSMRRMARNVFMTLRRDHSPDAIAAVSLEDRTLQAFAALGDRPLGSQLIRTHGDFHLGQVLHTGKDFVIIDFEGEPWRPLGTRLIKRSPLSDVAGMLRSFNYAIEVALQQSSDPIVAEQRVALGPWADLWYRWMAASFLRGYLDSARPSGLLPHDRSSLRSLLDVFLLEKAIYEIGYEAANRPAWLPIAVRGLRSALNA